MEKKYLKILALLPVFLVLLYSIHALGNEPTKKSAQPTQINDEVTKIVIDKNTTDQQFSDIMKMLHDSDIKAAFKNIKRNANGEIIAIDIDLTKDGETSHYSANSTNAIQKITIKVDDDFISITSDGIDVAGFPNMPNIASGAMTQHSNALEMLKKMLQENDRFTSSFGSINEDPFFKQFLSSPSGNANRFLNDNDYKYTKKINKTYIVNGKKVTEEAYEKMDKSQIQSLVIKNEVVERFDKEN